MTRERLIQAILVHREYNTFAHCKSYLRRHRFLDDDILRGRTYYICRQLDQRELYEAGYQLKLEVRDCFRKIYTVIAYK